MVKSRNVSYPSTVSRVWDLTSQYPNHKRVSWGVHHEDIYNKEKLWVKEDLQIDFFELSGGTPVKQKYIDLAESTKCKNSGTTLIDNKFLNIHGNDQFCTCAYDAESNPCPHKLQITGTGIDYTGKYQFFPNTVLPVDQVTPDVVATYGMAEPFEGCTEITNPEEVNGKWCIVYRGACFFQTKWDMCNNAGAIGTIIVMLDDSPGSGWQLWVEAVDTPLVAIVNSLGNKLRDSWRGGNRNIQLGVGKGIGVDAPDAEFSEPEPLVTLNYYTGVKTEDEASNFTTVQTVIHNSKTDYAHFIGVDGVGADIQVYDMDQSPPLYKGTYNVGIDGNYGFIYNEEGSRQPAVAMYAVDSWAGTVTFFDMQDELNPVQLSQITYDKCHEVGDDLHFAILHPSQKYIYLVPIIHEGHCDYKIRLYDISSLSDPDKLSEIHIPEVDDGANLYSVTFGLNNIAALSLSSSGVSWYDFSDPANPIPVAHIDLSEVENTYTLGARQVQQMADGKTWVIQDETEFWHNFHAVQIVEPTTCPDPINLNLAQSESCQDDSGTWMAVSIIFVVLAVFGCCGTVFFFYKWNLEVAFKFNQMEEFVDEKRSPAFKTEGGGTFEEDP